MTPEDELGQLLRTVVDALSEAEIPHMVVDSLASTAHGEPRSTMDIDLVIDPSREQLDRLLASLDPNRYYFDASTAQDALRRRSMFNLIEMATGWKVDLVIRRARAFEIEGLRRRTFMRIFGADVPTATAEDTIIAKLDWGKQGQSERQLRDVASILRVRCGSLDRAYIERWVAELELADEWRRAHELV